MKTIFISIFEGVEAKNILRTPIRETLLAEKDVRIVLFTKNEDKRQYYQAQFNDPRFIYEVIERRRPRGLDAIFSHLKFTLLRTKTTDLKRRMAYDRERNAFRYYAGLFLNRVLARPFVRIVARKLDFLLVRSSRLDPYFKKYEPDCVFLAHLFDEPEIEMLRAAKRFGVASVGFVNSWDKGTARAIMRLLPDKVVVFNEIVKKEIMKHDEMSADDMYVAGLPQYDIYKTHAPVSRVEFFKRYAFDPSKRLVIYAPMGSTFGNTDWDMMDLIHTAISSGTIKNAELLVRFQPNDFFDDTEIKKRPWLVYDYPGKRFSTKRGVDWDMDDSDITHLSDTLAHAALIISFASSISIDALAYDVPTINIHFEPAGKRPLYVSPIQYYHTEHYENVLRSDGVRVVYSPEMLIDSANELLDDPKLGKVGRERLKHEQWQFDDGKSGERIGHFILKHIHG